MIEAARALGFAARSSRAMSRPEPSARPRRRRQHPCLGCALFSWPARPGSSSIRPRHLSSLSACSASLGPATRLSLCAAVPCVVHAGTSNRLDVSFEGPRSLDKAILQIDFSQGRQGAMLIRTGLYIRFEGRCLRADAGACSRHPLANHVLRTPHRITVTPPVCPMSDFVDGFACLQPACVS